MSAPGAIYDTGKGTLSAALSGIDTQEERQAVRNLGSMAAATAGGITGAQAGAWLGAPLAPLTGGLSIPVGGVLGGALGGGLGLLGIDWFAENQGVDAPRTSKERLNDLAYNTAQGAAGDVAVRGMGAAAARAYEPIRKVATEAGRTEAAANVLRNTLGDGADITLAAKQIADDGTNPLSKYQTTAEALQTDAAAQLEKMLQQTDIGSPLTQQSVAREAARKQILKDMVPEGVSIDGAQRVIEQRIKDLRAGAETIDQGLPANVDPTVAGAGLREITEVLDDASGQYQRETWEAIPNREAPLLAPPRELMSAPSMMKKLFGPGSEGAPSDVRKLVETLDPEQKPVPDVDPTTRMLKELSGQIQQADPRVSLDYLQNARSWASEQASDYYGRGKNRAGAVSQAAVRDIDNILNYAETSGRMTPEQAKAYRKALEVTAEEKAIFGRGPTGRILRRGDGTSGYQMDSANVGRQFWNSTAESMDSFNKALGGNVKARELLVGDALTDFRKKSGVGSGDRINLKQARTWIRDHDAFLKTFPDIKSSLEQIYTKEAKAALKEQKLGSFVAANPEAAASVIFEGKDSLKMARDLKNELKGRPELLNGVRKGIVEHLYSKMYGVGDLNAKPTTFKNFLDKNGSVLRELFDEEQIKGFESLYADFSSQARKEDVGSLPSKGNSVTSQKESLHKVLLKDILDEFGTLGKLLDKGEEAGALLGATAGSGQGPIGAAIGGAAGATAGTKVGNIVQRAKRAVLQELSEAMADKTAARELLSKATPQNINKWQKLLEPKLMFFRRTLIGGMLGAREDDNKAFEDLASLLPQERLVAFPTTTPTQAADLAAALLQPASLRTMAGGQEMSTTKPKAPQAKGALVGDVDLTPRRIDPALVDAVVMQESAGKANAVGPRTKYGSAKGLMQLLDSTGKEWHKKLGLKGEYDPFNAEQNKAIGTAYLDNLTSRYKGSVPLALAAYNWGMGNLDKAIDGIGAKLPKAIDAELEQSTIKLIKDGMAERDAKRLSMAQIVDKYGPSILDGALPDETRNYVRKIMTNYNKKRGVGLVEV
jgi:soluble lytic murein transglycosylase-like protein